MSTSDSKRISCTVLTIGDAALPEPSEAHPFAWLALHDIDDQMVARATSLLEQPASWGGSGVYSTRCLDQCETSGVAGGALLPALQLSVFEGGDFRSNLAKLLGRRRQLNVHEGCLVLSGAWLAAVRQLADPDAPVYELYERIHAGCGDGPWLKPPAKDRVVRWAAGLPDDFVPPLRTSLSDYLGDLSGRMLLGEQAARPCWDGAGLLVYNLTGSSFDAMSAMKQLLGSAPAVLDAQAALKTATWVTGEPNAALILRHVGQLFNLACAVGTLIKSRHKLVVVRQGDDA